MRVERLVLCLTTTKAPREGLLYWKKNRCTQNLSSHSKKKATSGVAKNEEAFAWKKRFTRHMRAQLHLFIFNPLERNAFVIRERGIRRKDHILSNFVYSTVNGKLDRFPYLPLCPGNDVWFTYTLYCRIDGTLPKNQITSEFLHGNLQWWT